MGAVPNCSGEGVSQCVREGCQLGVWVDCGILGSINQFSHEDAEMKTHYIGHDRLYQQKKAKGQSGWNTDEQFQEFQTEVDQVLERGLAPSSGKLLELGCGAGNMSLWLATKGYQVYGIDIAPTAIEWADEHSTKLGVSATFSVGSVVNLEEYADNVFDFVLDGHCLHCIIGNDRARCLENVNRILKPGGYFLVKTMCGPVKDTGLFPEGQVYDSDSRCLLLESNGIATRYYGEPDKIVEEVESAGFHIANWSICSDEPSNDDLTIEALSR